jgi:hypothetical protein
MEQQPKRERKRIPVKPKAVLPAIEDTVAKKPSLTKQFTPEKGGKPYVHTVITPKNRTTPKPSSVFMRLETLPISRGKSTREDRQEIGKLCLDAFFRPKADGKKNQGAFKKVMREPEGDFEVMMYPFFFVRVIDSIIYNYYNAKAK